MFFDSWIPTLFHAWPLGLVLVGLLILVVYRMVRDKAQLEGPDARDRELPEEHRALIASAWMAWRSFQKQTESKT